MRITICIALVRNVCWSVSLWVQQPSRGHSWAARNDKPVAHTNHDKLRFFDKPQGAPAAARAWRQTEESDASSSTHDSLHWDSYSASLPEQLRPTPATPEGRVGT
ncbi:hypothetical protein AAFF_G00173440 [Aldrovandia affinis]|uniref:Secreted protein n=1 Tax=Aldrovandia affinis TaxID=143900 RepID=A0AAD7SZ31_9TELE|nr:hypothetical protein AAFF_G00173440 [Aldrovandia affinis]